MRETIGISRRLDPKRRDRQTSKAKLPASCGPELCLAMLGPARIVAPVADADATLTAP